jgi:hypothetical protein
MAVRGLRSVDVVDVPLLAANAGRCMTKDEGVRTDRGTL